MTDKEQIYDRLDAWGIAYDRMTHETAFHMEDCVRIGEKLNALHCKNYFLTTKSKKVYCLCVVRPNARLRTADISKQAGTPRLTFADETAMADMLHTHPGAVSPMGLIFDGEHRVRLLVDGALRNQARLAFHPCDNTETLALSAADFFEKFLPMTGCSVTDVEIHDFEEETP